MKNKQTREKVSVYQHNKSWFSLWAKSFVRADIDDCATAPCKHNGTCHDRLNDYRCTCVPGYIGKDCSTGKRFQGTIFCNNLAFTTCDLSSSCQVALYGALGLHIQSNGSSSEPQRTSSQAGSPARLRCFYFPLFHCKWFGVY